MKRYNVPRLSFINKMDRMGANPWKRSIRLNIGLRLQRSKSLLAREWVQGCSGPQSG
ncbi:hypothetical protein L211DRAFT_543716 [Terfezia boudieri ATCC MYA-4762]|uniref:Tr-type G domain-containing protein n=1 Tax=Terfezia boudieri ATCC MYA-4762 TaxID=1051890 RepID=A0A3N4M0H6_9PEZI|nr:hypothetical protein L211DRAFT_543716 [Terfezia boudieri ATCC MYA-4762]